MSIPKKILNKIDYYLKDEVGTVFKDHGGKKRIALIYPNVYSIGMSNLGFQTIYSILNSRDDVVCERAFLPDKYDLEELKRTGLPVITYESKCSISNFDIIALSISFENDYPNIIKILSLSNIPVYSVNRNDSFPLLIAGGVCCFSNPAPFEDIFDVIFIGESEETINLFLDLYTKRFQKDDIKREIVSIEGIYIPSFYKTDTIVPKSIYPQAPVFIKKTYFKNFNQIIINPTIKTKNSEFGHLCLLEVMRGCHWRCRFCLVSSIYNPVRIREKDIMNQEIDKAQSKVGLIAPSLSDVPYINELISKDNVNFSITSLRSNQKSNSLISLLKDKKSLSIAPEAGSEKLRRVINKKINEDDILSTASTAFQKGIEILRLYFMIGLPQERLEDIESIISLTKKILSLSKSSRIVLTLTPFVPKPFTAFQWHKFEDIKVLKEKINFIKKNLNLLSKITINNESVRHSFIQAVFARGDRKVLKNIIDLSQTGDMNKIIRDKSLSDKITTCWQYDEPLPWDFIDIGISKAQLWKEYQSAINDFQSY
ncbi:MAG TPA: radical SAM protein [Nitrospirae bacterium]|nr:radical SAM protein [Nitrospirota bacterium]